MPLRPATQSALANVRSNSGPQIELAGDAVDAWPLVSPFVSEQILWSVGGASGAIQGLLKNLSDCGTEP